LYRGRHIGGASERDAWYLGAGQPIDVSRNAIASGLLVQHALASFLYGEYNVNSQRVMHTAELLRFRLGSALL
jgi:hypothetical protein